MLWLHTVLLRFIWSTKRGRRRRRDIYDYCLAIATECPLHCACAQHLSLVRRDVQCVRFIEARQLYYSKSHLCAFLIGLFSPINSLIYWNYGFSLSLFIRLYVCIWNKALIKSMGGERIYFVSFYLFHFQRKFVFRNITYLEQKMYWNLSFF